MDHTGDQSVPPHLTLHEKAALLSGATVWETRSFARHGIRSLFLADGPHGVRRQSGSTDHLGIHDSEPATCFPTAAGIACTWDVALAEEIGTALGAEAAAHGVDVLLGPGLNIKRSPLGGRNFEYFSEDPLLAGRLAAGYVRGIQSQGVAATPKHFAANSQELRRMVSDSILDERTLREVYLSAFEIVVRESAPWAIMTSYNLINGTYTNEDPWLLQQVLRDEWGFDGVVVTDWGGGNDAVAAVAAGGTLEMPSPGFDSAQAIVEAVESGVLDEAHVDARVAELLLLADRTARAERVEIDVDAHHALARRAAAESAVLLRNQGDLLPLAPGTRVALIGDFARTPRYQGAGSSAVNPTRLVSVREAISSTELRMTRFAQGFRRDGVEDPGLRADAVDAARDADVALLFLGLPEISESEGIDRTDLRLPAVQVDLLRAVAETGIPVVVVISAGGVVEMPWAEHATALIHGHLGGQASAEGMLDVLTGAVSPAGHLAETVPASLELTPTVARFPSAARTAEYREGPFIGYRHTETVGAPVAFPFGFGLTYTSFAYSDLEVTPEGVSFTIRNTGQRGASAVPQLYISRPDDADGPAVELRAFTKVRIEAGAHVRVQLPLSDQSFRVFDGAGGGWTVRRGEYDVLIGAHVRDVKLAGRWTVEGDAPAPALRPSPYISGDVRDVSDQEFTGLLGRPLPSGAWHPLPLTRDDPLDRLGEARSPLARLLHRQLERRQRRPNSDGAPNLTMLFILNMPFRAVAKMTAGAVTMEMVDAFLLIVNGSHVRGTRALARAWRRARRLRREWTQRLGG